MKHTKHNQPLENISQMPRHTAIIMDGNGRWAKKRNLPRIAGHKKGAETLEKIVKAAEKIKGLECLTVFAFSSENWSRPEEEVSDLMALLKLYLQSKTAEFHKNNIQLKMIGDRRHLSKDIITLIEQAEQKTENNDGLILQVALSYSGQDDILNACRQLIAKDFKPEQITPELFESCLYTAPFNQADLLIRTSGELRISNFLLWQAAYSELIFSETLWPDFDVKEFESALRAYACRERRFGKVFDHIAAQ